jgi:hypothetical protein
MCLQFPGLRAVGQGLLQQLLCRENMAYRLFEIVCGLRGHVRMHLVQQSMTRR